MKKLHIAKNLVFLMHFKANFLFLTSLFLTILTLSTVISFGRSEVVDLGGDTSGANVGWQIYTVGSVQTGLIEGNKIKVSYPSMSSFEVDFSRQYDPYNNSTQDQLAIYLEWMHEGNIQRSRYFIGDPMIYNDTNGDGIFNRNYTYTDQTGKYVSSVSYGDEFYSGVRFFNNSMPSFGDPIIGINPKTGLNETYFNISYNDLVWLDSMNDYGGFEFWRNYVDGNGNCTWDVTYGFHVMEDNNSLIIKTDMYFTLNNLNVEDLSIGDFISVETGVYFTIEGNYNPQNVSSVALSFSEGNVNLGSLELGTLYDYNSTSGDATNLPVGTSLAYPYNWADGEVMDGFLILKANFKTPYVNGTTIIYDPTLVLSYGAIDTDSKIDGFPLEIFAILSILSVVIISQKKCKTQN